MILHCPGQREGNLDPWGVHLLQAEQGEGDRMRTLSLIKVGPETYQGIIIEAGNIYYHIVSTYYVPDLDPHTFQLLPHFTLTTTLCGRYCYHVPFYRQGAKTQSV